LVRHIGELRGEAGDLRGLRGDNRRLRINECLERVELLAHLRAGIRGAKGGLGGVEGHGFGCPIG
jgi:hypothetical protein